MSRPAARQKAGSRPTTRRTATGTSLRTGSGTVSITNNVQIPANALLTSGPECGTEAKENCDDNWSTTSKAYRPDSSNETKIDVFVRCRGRNEREVRENSGVVVKTDSVKSNTVELSMGSNALSNKTYTFDGVFSQTADQQMIFDEVVAPILDEVLKGFNCTIFAYGQTGTGKTYTMSGDISDNSLLDDAGIIPRVLHSLFLDLGSLPDLRATGTAGESSVKVSFIELYNEELRDLLSAEEKVGLKIFDGDGKRGAATLVQGMEERYITSAKAGIQLLRDGSHQRQVAATKCNDLSSRSHTVFTITAYSKRKSPYGEELVTSGKLNLVDLAGSENIRRSGAEDKRAAEAGLINKSLLTLGRVINALVDRSAHIPYRESKLTRLLQDSLGGRTKTCIIATLSPARSSLEETISTLDYAFRAKNIRNKPQIQLVAKKTLLREFTTEIEKLKSELTATRQRNGVYLTHEAYEELLDESESRRILIKEQDEKIETTKYKLARKGEDLVKLTSSLDFLKKDNQKLKDLVDSTNSSLNQTQAELADVKRMLNEETCARQQHERVELQLAQRNHELTTMLDQSTTANTDLSMKLQRRSEIQAQNRKKFSGMQLDVINTTTLVENRLAEFRTNQQWLMDAISGRVHSFIVQELGKLEDARSELGMEGTTIERSHRELETQTTHSKEELKEVLHSVRKLREETKEKISAGLNDLCLATKRISEGVMAEVETLRNQLHLSYDSLVKDFKTAFDEMLEEMNDQRDEVQRLWYEMARANQGLEQSQTQSLDLLRDLIDKESTIRVQENDDLIQHITKLVEVNTQQRELRLRSIAQIPEQLGVAGQSHSAAGASFSDGSEQLATRLKAFKDKVLEFRSSMNTQLHNDNTTATKHAENLQIMTYSVRNETTRVVKQQLEQLDTGMHALDNMVDHIKEQHEAAHATRQQSVNSLVLSVQNSYANLDSTLATSLHRVKVLRTDVAEHTGKLCETLPQLDADAHISEQLASLRARADDSKLDEYAHAGQTPIRRAYTHPTSMPRTSERKVLVELVSGSAGVVVSSPSRPTARAKALMFLDGPDFDRRQVECDDFIRPRTADKATSLRELDVNTIHSTSTESSNTSTKGMKHLETNGTGSDELPSLKRAAVTSASAQSSVPYKKHGSSSNKAASILLGTRRATQVDKENNAFPDDPGYDYKFPDRDTYPDDFSKWTRLEYQAYIEQPEKYAFLLVTAPVDEGGETVDKPIALGVWNVSPMIQQAIKDCHFYERRDMNLAHYAVYSAAMARGYEEHSAG